MTIFDRFFKTEFSINKIIKKLVNYKKLLNINDLKKRNVYIFFLNLFYINFMKNFVMIMYKQFYFL